MKTILYTIITSQFDQTLIATYNNKLCGLYFGCNGPSLVDRYLSTKFNSDWNLEFDWRGTGIKCDKVSDTLINSILNSISARSNFDDYILLGTPFQQKVWKMVANIPKGTTITYGAVAKLIGHPKAVRAVASAVANNPIGIIIPCHRVVPADGTVGQYAFGINMKRKLLEEEGILISDFKIKKELTIQEIEDKRIFREIKKALKSGNIQ